MIRICLALLLVGAVVAQDSSCDCSAAPEVTKLTSEAETLRSSIQQYATRLEWTEQEIVRLNSQLKDSQALQEQVSALESALKEKETALKSTDLKLKKTENSLNKAKSDLSACKADLHTEQSASASSGSQASETEQLRQRLQAAEEALLPPWLQRTVAIATAAVQKKLSDLRSGKHGEVGVKAMSYYDVAAEKAGVAYTAAAPKVAEGLAQAKVLAANAHVKINELAAKHIYSADWWKKLKVQYSQVEAELVKVVTVQLKSQPALVAYSDPVTVQYIVYAIFALPLALVLWILLSLLAAGSRSSRTSADGPRAKRDGAKSKAAKPSSSSTSTGSKGSVVKKTKGTKIQDGGDTFTSP